MIALVDDPPDGYTRKYPAVPALPVVALAIADTFNVCEVTTPKADALPAKVTRSVPVSAVAQVAGGLPVQI